MLDLTELYRGAFIAFVGSQDARAGSAGAIVLFLGVFLGFYASTIVRVSYEGDDEKLHGYMDALEAAGKACDACKGKNNKNVS